MLKKLSLIVIMAAMCSATAACTNGLGENSVESSSPNFNNSMQDIDDNEQAELNETKALSVEEAVYAAYIQADTSEQEKVQLMLKHIAGIDWTAYNTVSGHKTLETVEYLYNHIDKIAAGDYGNIFMANTNLDGASGESYAAITGELFVKNRSNAVKALAGLRDHEQRESVISSIAYNLSYKDKAQVKKDIIEWRTAEELSAEENKVIDALLSQLDHPY